MASPPKNPAMQGSALRRAPDPAATKIQANGSAEPRRSFRVCVPGSCARDWRPIRHALLDCGGTASRLDELSFAGVCPIASRLEVPDFAGVCPIASPDPADTKFHLNGGCGATAILSRNARRFVRKGLT
jgi:hypothetical protein